MGTINTYSGEEFDPTDPRPEDFKLEDIAHGLSLNCRFAGQSRDFYSVAQHPINVSRCLQEVENAGPRHQLYGMLHDASEAYSADIPGPVKSEFERFQEAEDRMMDAIWEWSGLGPPPEITTENGGTEKFWKPVDRGVLHCEGKQLLGGGQWDDQEIERYGKHVELGGSADFEALEAEFIDRAQSLADVCDDGVRLRG